MPPKKSASKASAKPTAALKNTSSSKTTAPKARAAKTSAASKPSVAESKKRAPRAAATESRKRKAESVEKEEKEAPAPREPKKARVAKPRPVAAPKPKVVINTAPTTRLNVYVCGEGSSGELGLGAEKNAVDVKRPRLNPHLPADRVGVVQVAVGGMHCVALTHDNKILTWGVNDQGALGRDTNWDGGYKDIDDNKSDSDSDDDDPALNPRESTPTAIPSEAFPENTVFVQVAAGDSSSFALTDDGLVYGWGTFRVRFHFIIPVIIPSSLANAVF